MGDMTATERLRAMLAGRGVECSTRKVGTVTVTHWHVAPSVRASFADGAFWTELTVQNATPEQAVAATLGTGPACEGA